MVGNGLGFADEEVLGMIGLLDGTETFFNIPVAGFHLLELLATDLPTRLFLGQIHGLVPLVVLYGTVRNTLYKIKAF